MPVALMRDGLFFRNGKLKKRYVVTVVNYD